MVIFLNGGNSYEQKEMVFERQIDDSILKGKVLFA